MMKKEKYFLKNKKKSAKNTYLCYNLSRRDEKMKNTETIKTAVIIVLALVLVFGGSFMASELKNKNTASVDNAEKESSTSNDTETTNNETTSEESSEEDEIPESEQKELKEIDIDKYLSLKKGDDKAIIYVARPTCHYCQEQEPIMKNIVYEYDAPVNYLNTDELDDDGQNKLIKSDDYFSEGYGTPLILIVQKNEIIDKIEGLSTKDNIVSLFKKHDFIKD